MDASETTATKAEQHLAQLEELLGEAEKMFRAGFGTAPARRKSGGSVVKNMAVKSAKSPLG